MLQIELLDERRQVVRVRIHVVAVPRLTRAAVSATVVRDAPIAMGCEKEHLIFKGVGRQWPPVTKDDRPAGCHTPVFKIDLGSVVRCNVIHVWPPLDVAEQVMP